MYTSQEIKWEHIQEANAKDGKYFNYEKIQNRFLIFNLDRDTFNYFDFFKSKNVGGDLDRYNWVMVDERYKGGLTENQDLFFMGDFKILTFIC